MTVPLRENLHKLRQDGRNPRPVGAYTLALIRGEDDGEIAIVLELRREPGPDILWTWSKMLDPQLDEISQILGLIMNAIAEFDDAMSIYSGRVTTLRATMGHMPQRDVTLFLEGELKRAQGNQSIPDRNEAFHTRMRVAARDVDTIRLTTALAIPQSR